MKTTAKVATDISKRAKQSLLQPRKAKEDGRFWWALSCALLFMLVALTFSMAADAKMTTVKIKEKPTVDYVSRSLNKTVVVTRHGTQTISQPRGSGVRYRTVIRDHKNHGNRHSTYKRRH